MFLDRPGAPELLSSSITGEEDWDTLKGGLRPDMARFHSVRKEVIFGQPLSETQGARYDRCRAEGAFTVLVPVEPCWYFLRLLGEESALVTMATNPGFAGRLMEDYNRFTLGMVKAILAGGYRFDALWVFSDLCYKNGMLFSPQFYKERVFVLQKRLFDLAKENGMRVIYHCDGNIRELLPLLIGAGIDCIQPLEVRAGNDVRHYMKSYPGAVSYMGNIDMDVFPTTREAIEREVTAKILAAKGSHRYLFHSDHSVPTTVSLENYAHGIRIAKELAPYGRGTSA
jgi:uroporphyrinogen decarboxylase